jgi:formiminotetrahydrofolate cyclodeaminase
MSAYRLPRDSNEEKEQRSKAIEEATLEATRIPLDVAEKALEVMKIAALVIAKGNINAITDGGTGAALAHAGIKGAGLNVRVNVADLKNKTSANKLIEKLISIEEIANGIEKEVWSVISERGS